MLVCFVRALISVVAFGFWLRMVGGVVVPGVLKFPRSEHIFKLPENYAILTILLFLVCVIGGLPLKLRSASWTGLSCMAVEPWLEVRTYLLNTVSFTCSHSLMPVLL